MKTKPLLIYTTLAFFGLSAIGLWKGSFFKSKSKVENELQKKYSMCTNFSIPQDPKAPSIGGVCKISEEDYSKLKSIKNNSNLETMVSSNEISTSVPRDYSKIYEGSRLDVSLLGIQAAKYYELEPPFVLAIIDVESDFVKEGISNKGACGPMQVMPSTAKKYYPNITRKQLCDDPVLNIEIGVRELKSLLEETGDYKLAIAAYNGGRGAIKNSKAPQCKGKKIYECKDNKGYKETRNFLNGYRRCEYNKKEGKKVCEWKKGVWDRYLELRQNY